MSQGKIQNRYTIHNTIQLIKGGASYFQLLGELIEKASHSIFIRVYIWDDDATGTLIANHLFNAAERGVAIYIVADGYASQCLSKRFIKRLKEKGLRFRYFEPLLKSSHFYFGRRMHEKLVVIDGKYGLIGGINFADRYNDIDSIPAWLDYALYVEGEAAWELYQYCASDWNLKNKLQPPYINRALSKTDCSVRVSRNDWVKGKHQVWRSYFNLFNQAEESITIMCSYFLPGRVLRNKLYQAAKRGVKIKLILAGPSDVMLAKHAERYLYRWMLKNGFEIYEYQPAVLHAKIACVDNHWVTIGSYNINNVSAYASMELNLDIRNRPFAAAVETEMEAIIDHNCIRVSQKNPISNTNFLTRFLQKLSYEFIRAVINLSTFYFKHE